MRTCGSASAAFLCGFAECFHLLFRRDLQSSIALALSSRSRPLLVLDLKHGRIGHEMRSYRRYFAFLIMKALVLFGYMIQRSSHISFCQSCAKRAWSLNSFQSNTACSESRRDTLQDGAKKRIFFGPCTLPVCQCVMHRFQSDDLCHFSGLQIAIRHHCPPRLWPWWIGDEDFLQSGRWKSEISVGALLTHKLGRISFFLSSPRAPVGCCAARPSPCHLAAAYSVGTLGEAVFILFVWRADSCAENFQLKVRGSWLRWTSLPHPEITFFFYYYIVSFYLVYGKSPIKITCTSFLAFITFSFSTLIVFSQKKFW